jgi:hypothetical protein
MFAAALLPGDREALADGFIAAAEALAELEAESGEREVLGLEPEPRSSANDTRELGALFALVLARARGRSEAAVQRHLGACLDACHAAVEFEETPGVLERATADSTALGKLQFSSALVLARPDDDERGRKCLLALDEPVYLHQVTARRDGEFARALDLSELTRLWSSGARAWRDCDEWRCHFHVPVDLARWAGEGGGLATTQAEAARLLKSALSCPERWGSRELHVEMETYTWNLLRPAASGRATLVDGLEREIRHVLGLLAEMGWRPEAPSSRR